MTRIISEAIHLPHAALESADWADRWAIDVAGLQVTAPQATQAMFGRTPAWVRALLAVRDRIVRLFGLKAAGPVAPSEGKVSGFPVLSSGDDQVVLGFDDKHLDFRIVIDVKPTGGEAHRVSVTTLVDRHNLFGRFYIAVVTPFHRVIVRNTLARLQA